MAEFKTSHSNIDTGTIRLDLITFKVSVLRFLEICLAHQHIWGHVLTPDSGSANGKLEALLGHIVSTHSSELL